MTFVFTPFGKRADDGALACDGLVDGAAIDLSHWAGNATPREWKADTSVEIAMNFAAANSHAEIARRTVTNNHFDTDGVLAVWTLLEPARAEAHRDALLAAAEVGDFDEWPADERGLKLDAALGILAQRAAGSDARKYERVLPAIAPLLDALDAREDLWGAAMRATREEREKAERGALRVISVGRVTVLQHAVGTAEFAGPVLFAMAPRDATRWLLAFEERDGRFAYRYERRRWAWADTVERPRMSPPSRNALARAVGAADWAVKGELGMTGLLRTKGTIAQGPEEVAGALERAESARA